MWPFVCSPPPPPPSPPPQQQQQKLQQQQYMSPPPPTSSFFHSQNRQYRSPNFSRRPPSLLQQPTTVPSNSVFLVPTSKNGSSMGYQQPQQESIYFPSPNKMKHSTAGAVNHHQTGSAPLPLLPNSPIPQQFRAAYQALKNQLNIKQVTINNIQNALKNVREVCREKYLQNKVALENVISEQEAQINDLQKTLNEVQKELTDTKSSIKEKDAAQKASAKRIEAECENKWKKKMDVLTEWEITLKMQQQVLELDRENLKKAKANQEERTSKQYEHEIQQNYFTHEMDRLQEQLRKMETAKDEQTKMLNEANAKIEELTNQLRAQSEAHSGQIGVFQKNLEGKEEAIRKLQNEIIAAKNETNSEREIKETLFGQLDNCHQQYGCQIAELKKTLKEAEHKIRQQAEHIKVALDALMKCIPSNNNQGAGHVGNSSHKNSLPQAKEYSTSTSSILGGHDCTNSSLDTSATTSSKAAAEAEREQNEATAETFGWDVEFVEEVTRDYKMLMPRMKKEGEDWSNRLVPPTITLEDDEEECNGVWIPTYNYNRHMAALKRRPIKKEEPRNEEDEQQRPGTSENANGNGRAKKAVTPSAMYLRERKRGLTYAESRERHNKKGKK